MNHQNKNRAQVRLNSLLKTLSTSTKFTPKPIESAPEQDQQTSPILLGHLTISDISLPIWSSPTSTKPPTRFPSPLPTSLISNPFTLSHLRWISQKTLLSQDICLISPTASCPYTRKLVLGFCELAKREYEYIGIHRDLSENELKQSREISASVFGSKSKLQFIDSATVRAVKLGRILILDGLEKAERGILPLLNNLLENREMNLEDGTHIIHPDRYDSLSRSGSLPSNFISASRSFQVICITLPVPPFTGYPLDPPFRSRFQARYIDSLGASLALASPFSSHPLWIKFKEVIMTIQLSNESRSSSLALSSSPLTLPNFPIPSLSRLKTLLENFPVSDSITAQELSKLVRLLHPRLSFLSSNAWDLLNQHFEKAGLVTLPSSLPEIDPDGGGLFGYKLVQVERINSYQAQAHFESDRNYSNQRVQCLINCGSSVLIPINEVKSKLSRSGVLISSRFDHLFNLMVQIHTINLDFTLLPRPTEQASSSTSFLIQTFSQVFGYGPKPEESIHLYREMTGKELVMRRTVNEGNQTGWASSRLVEGAQVGALVEITGIDLIGSSVGTISGLLDGRALELWDCRRLVPFHQKHQSEDPMVSVVNPSFRVICTATKSGMGTSNSGRVPEWMSNDELGNISMMIEMIGLKWEEEIELMKDTRIDETLLNKLSVFVKAYRDLSSQGGKLRRLGTRGLLRICKRLGRFPEEELDLGRMLRRILLVEFLPKTERMDFERCLELAEIKIEEEWDYLPPIISSDKKYLIFPSAPNLLLSSQDHHQELRLKECQIERESNQDNEDQGLVPEMSWFFENREQNGLIRDIGIDLMLMGNHLVLLGNQGVGKNKIIDRLLMLLRRPREYIQLHRDSTVQQLMFQTSVVDGTIQYLDSPLLRAVRYGRVLVVDEADKAPEHVTGALKSLSERGEMSLGDGRRIVKQKTNKEGDIEIHSKFKMVLLANRPGYPFLGHQFLQVLGDGFGCYGIKNPDLESEIELVEQLLLINDNQIGNEESVFGKSLEEQKAFVRRLVGVFHLLREDFENGMISYPFSLRELLNLVKHLKSFPQDGLEVGMRNVFDFDVHRTDTIDKVNEALVKNGFKFQKLGIERIRKMGEEMKIEDQIRVVRQVKVFGDEVESEHDEHGVEAEIGEGDGDGDGESWGGGVGSLDSSGMREGIGSKKILKRTNVYDQKPSDNSHIGQQIRERAKALSREELEKKLKDLSMRIGEVSYYGYYYKPIEAHIPLLVDILENLEAREEERVWVKGQSDGEFDEQRLVDGLIGESAIYKRRVNQQPEPGRPQLKPKRIRFVFDISSSMYRFQADGRLDRSCQTAIMIMESFSRLKRPERYHWDMIGHAGDGPEIDLGFEEGGIQSQWKVVEKMRTFSQYAIAGDHTVEAIEKAVDKVAEVESDEAIVIAISDANFDRYGITSQLLKDAMNRNKSVKTGLIAIGEGSETVWLPKVLPQQAYRVEKSSEIPIVLRSILSHLLI